MIERFEKFVEDKDFKLNPVSDEGVAAFVCYLADEKTSYAEICKVSPALTVLHSSQGHKSTPSVKHPYVKLLIEGAKREGGSDIIWFLTVFVEVGGRWAVKRPSFAVGMLRML